MMHDVELIFDVVLQYNVENMNNKNEVPEEVSVIQDLKSEFIEAAFAERDYYPQEIPWECYIEVVKKVITQHKACFRDFCMSGPKFKVAIYILLNRIYRNEIVPEKLHETKLMKLFKGRGDINDLKNHRFIHGKPWLSKLFEKCLMKIINLDINRFTPECQICM